jgi:hypothetical protein
MKTWRLIPAYGRDYETPTEVRKDFEDNKDFTISDISDRFNGKYVNREQMAVGDAVFVRYGNLRKVLALVVLDEGQWKLECALTKTQKLALLGASRSEVQNPRVLRTLKKLGLLREHDAGLTEEGRRVLSAIESGPSVGLAGEELGA